MGFGERVGGREVREEDDLAGAGGSGKMSSDGGGEPRDVDELNSRRSVTQLTNIT